MSYVPVGINQGDTIYYYDTSVGDVVARDWFFPGGTPTGATSYGPAVVYNSPNASGWDTTLLVTDNAGITAQAVGKNIIVVIAENFSVSFTATPSSSLIDQSITYQSTTIADSGVTGYAWVVPGLGSTSGVTLSNFSHTVSDWYDLGGTHAGSPNALYFSAASLTVTSNVGNVGTANQNISYYKLGPQELVDYTDTGTYAISGPYYNPTIFGYTTNTMGLGGNNLVLEINQNISGQEWDNSYFHSTAEAVYYYPNTSDYSANYDPLKFRFIWNGTNLSSSGITVPNLPRFNVGNYIITGDVNTNFSDKFWITDYTTSGALLTEYSAALGVGSRKWSTSYIQSFMANTYHLSNSSKYIENAGFSTPGYLPLANLSTIIGVYALEAGYGWNGGYAGAYGVAIPTRSLINDYYSISGVSIGVDVKIYDTSNNIIDTIAVDLTAGGTGNTPDGYLMKAQSDGYGQGIASRLNSAFSSAGWGSYLLAEAQSYYSCYENGAGNGVVDVAYQYDSSKFYGLRVSVTQPEYSSNPIGSLSIEWSSSYLSAISSVNPNSVLKIPFAGSSVSSPNSFRSWTGMNQRIYTNPNTTPYFRGWKLGGSL